jgi:biopolymer transport protein ExbD
VALTSNQSAEQDHFDLLPFIAIMMCLLGTLLLVTMSMAAINVGAGSGEGWIPEPEAGAKIPVLIEWDGIHAIWHSDTGYRQLDPDALAALMEYLETHRNTHYALFAVRSSGFGTFRKFAAKFENRHLEIGFEPIEQGKAVRLLPPAKAGPK